MLQAVVTKNSYKKVVTKKLVAKKKFKPQGVTRAPVCSNKFVLLTE